MGPHKSSVIEFLPLDILLLLLTYLNGTDRLLFALSSPLIWNTYRSTRPTIPNLWTLVKVSESIISHPSPELYDFPENYPRTIEAVRPLGCLLQQWMGPKHRMIRFSKEQGKNTANFKYEIKSQLPPFFVRVRWRDSKYWFRQDESKLFRRYAIYHACHRDIGEETDGNDEVKVDSTTTGRRYPLPHPRGMSAYRWHYAVKKAIEDDRCRWRTWDEWEQWWLNYNWWGLESRAKDYAEELVKGGLGIPDPNHNLG